MKNVLWVSRHEMTESQLRDLTRVMGDAVRLLPIELLAGHLQRPGFHRGRGPADAEQSGRCPEVRSIPA